VEVDQHDSYEIVGMKHVEENPVNKPEVENDEDDEKNHEFRDDEIQELANEEEMNENDDIEEIQHEVDDIGGIVTRSGRRASLPY
jgi:hypothetical protein